MLTTYSMGRFPHEPIEDDFGDGLRLNDGPQLANGSSRQMVVPDDGPSSGASIP